MNKYILLIGLSLTGLLYSCSDWLDVKPTDRISEENAFSSVAGFKEALNGIYVELNRPNLYGQSLTCEFVEILAQRYAVSKEAVTRRSVMDFEYTSSSVKKQIENIWGTAYNLIANVNLILKNCEARRTVLPDDYYALVKGEALALRGMLHFDLFRLFGPAYLGSDTLKSSIPYYQEFSLNSNQSLPSNEFVGLVMKDLQDALTLLQEDPIITMGPKGDLLDNFKADRNLRLNYYAVEALLARVCMYIGDKASAALYANKVIEVQGKWFPFINPMNIAPSLDNPDRVFSTELLFALQNLNRTTTFTSLFDGRILKLNTLLAPRADVTDYIFEKNKEDYRYKTWLGSTVELGGASYCVFNKFQGKDSLFSQMIPMLRVSEMYLIASETATKSADGIIPLNVVRNARGLQGVTTSSLSTKIEAEYRREFYGEGQLFFYYKRKKLSYIKSATDNYTMDINVLNYKLPIPDAEIKYN